jgi:hypothetical protein
MATDKKGAIVPLMARMMVPFRRILGYSFDTDAFLNDETYAKIILDEAMASTDANLQNLGKQIAQLYAQPGSMTGANTRPMHTQQPQSQFAQTQQPTSYTGFDTNAPPEAFSPTGTSHTFLPTGTSLSPEADAMRAELIRKYKGGIR